mmetsp:Transcript_24565/g.52977  ORF Transcript_24565/g.52977 Transcript_24565/m.52977 type:complete len:242 (+) Transcript_24565:148-873(+)
MEETRGGCTLSLRHPHRLPFVEDQLVLVLDRCLRSASLATRGGAPKHKYGASSGESRTTAGSAPRVTSDQAYLLEEVHERAFFRFCGQRPKVTATPSSSRPRHVRRQRRSEPPPSSAERSFGPEGPIATPAESLACALDESEPLSPASRLVSDCSESPHAKEFTERSRQQGLGSTVCTPVQFDQKPQSVRCSGSLARKARSCEVVFSTPVAASKLSCPRSARASPSAVPMPEHGASCASGS